MVLFIDTTDFNKVTYALSGQRAVKKIYKVDAHQSHQTLGLLDKFLRSNKINPAEIKKIVVNKGPGSFTGTRIGVVHAMAMGFAWNIPVKFLAADRFAS